MGIFDFVLILILAGFILFGFFFGLVHSAGALLGVVIGAFVASHTFEPLAELFAFFFGGNLNLSRIVVFAVIFVFVNRLVGFGFYILEKFYQILQRVPYLRTIDKLGGSVLGFVEGSLVLGMILFVTIRFPWNDFIAVQLVDSTLTPVFVGVAQVLVPLIPKVLQQLQAII